MIKIFCISGLGADEKIFSNLNIHGYELAFIKWISPLPNETIENYASRLLPQINDPFPILLGVSFGGIMCVEIGKLIKARQILLLSSVKRRAEMPLWMRFAGRCKLHKLITIRPYNFLDQFENNNLGAKTAAEKEMVRKFRKTIDISYLQWSINAILSWKNENVNETIYHIHGDRDKIFPIKLIKGCQVIKGGGHLMVFNMSDLISEIILKKLLSLQT